MSKRRIPATFKKMVSELQHRARGIAMNEPEESKKVKDRVNIDESVIEIYRELKSDANTIPEQSPFSTFKDVFMLAVCLGYRARRRQKLPTGGNKHDIRVTVFSDNDLALLKGIAIASTGDVEVLGRPGEILTIAEEYAQVGIYNVKASLLDERGHPLWNLVELVTS
ncbi:MAG: hypothetical protein KDI79_09255 [Anaerolineae bacterium]|nr:hypothetical protein [Anaerolineae bacterium]